MQTPYDQKFYAAQRLGSLRSAERILPRVLDVVRPTSIVDVGCGVGTWLAVACRLGIRDFVGLDGEYVDQALLQVPRDHFSATDLSRPFTLGRRFDLAMSLEVAEHLLESSAPGFIESLTRLAPVILFSAAIPNQGGTNHVNEQWQDYWAKLFDDRDYAVIDCIRQHVWNDGEVDWWYAQNTFLMCHKQHFGLVREKSRSSVLPLCVVHPRAWQSLQARILPQETAGIRRWLGSGPHALRSSVKRIAQHFFGYSSNQSGRGSF